MKHALITASVVALVAGIGLASVQGMDERREAPAVAPEQKAPEGQTGLQSPSAPQMSQKAKPDPTALEPETTGWGSPAVGGSLRPGASAATREERRTAAEVRRVRAAVERTLRRTQEMFRTASH
jgi:hypothetical protein